MNESAEVRLARYGVTRSVLTLLEAVGWLGVLLGVVSAIMGFANLSEYDFAGHFWLASGLSLFFGSLFMVGAARVGSAIVDIAATSNASKETLNKELGRAVEPSSGLQEYGSVENSDAEREPIPDDLNRLRMANGMYSLDGRLFASVRDLHSYIATFRNP